MIRKKTERAARIVCIVIGFLTTWAPSIRAGNPQVGPATRVAGTGVSLVAPTGFQAATSFPGFQQEENAASIMVSEIAGSAAAMQAAMTATGLASQGMRLVSSEPASFGGMQGVVIAVTQSSNGIEFRKWLGVFGTAKKTAMVVAAFPSILSTELSESLKRAVLSARWSSSSPGDPYEGLSYRLKETKTFKVSTRLSNTITLTKAGAKPPLAPEEPFVLVGPSISTVTIGDLEAFAKARLSQLAKITGIRDLKGTPATVGGLPGYELTGVANDVSSGASLFVYQALVVRRGSYYLIVGMVGTGQADIYLSEFRDIAGGLSFVD